MCSRRSSRATRAQLHYHPTPISPIKIPIWEIILPKLNTNVAMYLYICISGFFRWKVSGICAYGDTEVVGEISGLTEILCTVVGPAGVIGAPGRREAVEVGIGGGGARENLVVREVKKVVDAKTFRRRRTVRIHFSVESEMYEER